jgi:RHS repeat-associated protein
VNRLLDVRSTQLLTSEGTAFASSQMNQFENPETKHLQSRTTNPLTGSTTIGAFFDVNDVQSGFIYDNLKYQAGVRGLAPEGHKERWIDTQLTWDLPPVYFEPASFAGYDEIGRTKTIGDRTFSWNDRDLIEEISWIDGRKLTFKHDGSGNCYRIDRYLVGGAFDRTDILVWNGSKVAARYLLEDDGELKLQRTYFAAGHIDHGENGTLNDKFFYAKDHLGSPRVVFQEQDDSFVERARYDYDAFGNRVLLSGGAPAAQLDCGFTGHYYLPEAKLYLTHFRLYDPGLGRWLTREPLGEGASLNLYRYCHNDPVNYWDPNGLFELRFSHNFTEEERVLITQLMDNMLAQVRSLLAESESLLQEMNQNPSCFGSLIDDLGKAKKIFEGMEKGLAGDEVLRFYRRASIPSKNKGQANARWRPYYGLKNIDLNNREGGALRNRDLVELSLSLFHEISHYAGSEDPEFGLIWDFIPHDFENAYNLQELHNRPLKNWLNFGPAYRRSKRECEGSSGETE